MLFSCLIRFQKGREVSIHCECQHKRNSSGDWIQQHVDSSRGAKASCTTLHPTQQLKVLQELWQNQQTWPKSPPCKFLEISKCSASLFLGKYWVSLVMSLLQLCAVEQVRETFHGIDANWLCQGQAGVRTRRLSRQYRGPLGEWLQC